MTQSKVHIIAEAGTNHVGKLETAKRLVDIAKEAKADSVKFQIIYPDGLYLPRFYRGNGNYEENKGYAIRASQVLPDADYPKLDAYCKQVGLPMSATAFDPRGLALVKSFDPPFVKIASCDLNNGRLLRQAAELGKTMIVSTGMSNLGDVEEAVDIILGTGNKDLVLMHCVSVYPATLEQSNLGFLDTLKTAFGLPIGLSDHTESSLAAAIAVAKGVTWIEKHFTYDRKAPEGYDHSYAMEPGPFAQYVADIRAAEIACARPARKIIEKEDNVRKGSRRSIYAAREIAAGEVLREEDVVVVRPRGELVPNDLPLVIGAKTRKALRQYEAVTREAIDTAQ